MRGLHIAILAMILAACGDRSDPEAGRTAAPADRPATPAERPTIPQAEALGVLRAIGDAEIGMAQVAQKASQSGAILGYAGVVIADHRGIGELIDTTLAKVGESRRDNVISTTLRLQGDSIARALGTLSGGFNNTYIEEQIRSQQNTLQLLDTLLIPSARDSAVQYLMRAVRPTIAAHLQRAMQILAERQRAAAERGEAWRSGFDAPAPSVGPELSPDPRPEMRTPVPVSPDTAEPPDTSGTRLPS